MGGIKEQKNIDELRHRLYDRAERPNQLERHSLTRSPIEVSRGWDEVSQAHLSVPDAHALPSVTEAVLPESPSVTPAVSSAFEEKIERPRRRYRRVIVLMSLLFFIMTVGASSVYLFFGANQISARNINVALSTPLMSAGGDVMRFEVGITNQNSVPVRSALLVVNYPSGTRAADEAGRELYEERLTIEDVAPGASVKVPLQAVLYGEENEEKEIFASLQYRVEGSNGVFEKTAEPQKVRISSSPVLVQIRGVEKVSAGQEMELRVQIRSNATIPQRNLLLTLSYPGSYRFVRSTPEPSYGQNSWIISELPPQGTTEIVLYGRIEGFTDSSASVAAQVGNPQLGNQFILDTVLAQSRLDFTLEKPFTGVTIGINGDTDGSVVINPGDEAAVTVLVKNTLEYPIYDLRVELKPTGNLIRDDLLKIREGFYDASEKTIRFDASGNPQLYEVMPDEIREFSFTVGPDTRQQTASFSVSVELYARRVDEPNAAESLIGTGLAEAKYSSIAELGSQLGHVSGPVPPVAGETTTYTATMIVTAGVNDMTNAVVTTKLPQYISWLDTFSGEGKVEFNPLTKEIRWQAGDVSAGRSKSLDLQVSLLPSVTQVGGKAIVIENQSLTATDRFTGAALYATQAALSNELSTELGFPAGNGTIQAAQ